MLVASNIRHSYNGNTVLDCVSLSLVEGTVTCLLGPSGCGKSTLLNILAGFIKPTKGSVDSALDLPGPKLGYLSQDPGLLPWLTASQNVVMGPRLHPSILFPARETIAGYFKRFDLNGYEDYYPSELSGGQQQRVALIRTLLAEPKLLLLDEPLGHLDCVMRLKISSHIRHYVQKHQATALIVTHQLDEAIYVADKIIRLSEKPTRIIDEHALTTEDSRHELFAQLSERSEDLDISDLRGMVA